MSDKIASITIMILNTIPASLMPNPSSYPTPTTGIEMAIYAMVKKVDVISACLYSGATDSLWTIQLGNRMLVQIQK